ncbi:hypothetical protein ACHAQA_002084 [Verticillium albo-atrum]
MSEDLMTPADDVIVSLTFPYHEEPFPERRIVLNTKKSSVLIGRTSKRVPDLSAALDNGWLDSPVISRNHAEIFLDHHQEKAVYIRDRHSRHGTFLNKARVYPGTPVRLRSGDFVRFGIDIQRDHGLFPPPAASIDIEFVTRADRATSGTHTPVDRSVGYHAPDPSDDSDGVDSDECDDEDRKAVRRSVIILRTAAVQRAPKLVAEKEPLARPPHQCYQLSKTSKINSGSEVIDIEHYKPPGETVIDLTVPGLQTSPIISHPTAVTGNIPEVLNVDDDDEENNENGGAPKATGMQNLGNNFTNPLGLDTSESEHDFSDDEAELDPAPLGVWNSSLLASTEHSSDEDDEDFDDERNDSTDSDEGSLSDSDEAESIRDESMAVKNLLYTPAPPSSGWATYEEAPRSADENHEAGSLPAVETDNTRVPLSPQGLPWMLPPLQQILGSNGIPQPSFTTSMDTPLQDVSCISGSAANVASQPTVSQNLPPWREPPVSSQYCYQGPAFNMWRAENEEYLTARESNKELVRQRVAASDKEAPEASTTLLSAPTVGPALADVPKLESNPPPVCQLSPPENESDEVFDLAPQGTDDIEPQTAAQTAWIDSGDRFLTEPCEDFPISDVRHSPELDMTSAWSFQQSKMAAATLELEVSPPKATTAASRSNIDTTGDCQDSHLPASSSKRKACDISDISPAEEVVETAAIINDGGAPGSAALQDLNRQRQLGASESERCQLGIHDCGHSPKRLRRMAEAAGLVALGGAAAGVAFITTLIATAPAL